MKVLFVFKSENFLCPTGLCVLSAAVKARGHESALCEMNSADPLESIAAHNPDLVAYSSSTGEAKHYLSLNRRVKERFPRVFTIMGGHHPTFYPELLLTSDLDALCIGEGEGALGDVLDRLKAGAAVDDVPNIVTRKNFGRQTVRPLIADLDSLPFPDYALVYDNTPMGTYPLKSIITSRGCPFHCTYCFNPGWNEMYRGKGPVYRRHSVDYVLKMIQWLRGRWPLSYVKFYDDVFFLTVDDWFREFCERYPKEVGLPFFILCRAESLTEEAARMIKTAGCHTISMSIEAGNPDIRSRLLKREGMTDRHILDAHERCTRLGIFTFTNCITGIPETTTDDDIMSVDLAIKAKCTWAEFPIFFPFPGTELGRRAVGKGYYTPEYENMHTSYQYRSPMKCFSERELNAQMNLAILGPVAVVMPRLRNLIVRRMIFWPNNVFFTFLYYFTKMYVLRRKIYVTKTNWLRSVYIFLRSLKQEWFRHVNKKG